MRKRAFSFIILLLLFIIIPGCSSSEDTKEPYNSFLWEVTSDTTTVYVLGSVHIASSDLYPLSNTIEDAYDRSQHLVVEIDMTSINIWEAQKLMLDKAKYPAGENLQDNITGELYNRVQKRWKQLGLSSPLLVMDDYEPWFVTQIISETEMLGLGYSPEHGIDMYFMNKANEDNLSILEFETVQFQLDLLDSMPEDLQILGLEEMMETPPTKKDIERMFEAWENGDIYEIERIVTEDLEEYPQLEPYYERMLDERNFGMVRKIEGFLEDDEIYFVVVGAGHLVGENGIINLLEEKGYLTEQL